MNADPVPVDTALGFAQYDAFDGCGRAQAGFYPGLCDRVRQVPRGLEFAVYGVAGGAAAVPVAAGMGVVVGDGGEVDATIGSVSALVAGVG